MNDDLLLKTEQQPYSVKELFPVNCFIHTLVISALPEVTRTVTLASEAESEVQV